MMRIIAGKYRKTPLETLAGEDITRPTKDMVREALFSSIMINGDDSFLDLFSGTGAIGIEALSRGARDVVFNDMNRDAARIIRKNLQKVKEDRKVYELEYKTCLRELKGHGFDYVYCDPPYAFADHDMLFRLLDEYAILDERGIIIIEVNKQTDLQGSYGPFSLFKERRYGKTKLYYYRREERND